MIVAANANVRNAVFLGQVIESFDKSGAIVSDDLAKGTPPAQDFFKDPFANSLTILRAKLAKLWPS